MRERILGRYEVVSQLGRGAMGTVYKAHDPVIERTVAIKTLNPDLPKEELPQVKERFLREARSAGRLNHPNVVTIYDVGEVDGTAFICMEYLEGQSLRDRLDAGAREPLHTLCDIAAQIADGLDYAQRFGIVHRDVKPANIMISPEGLAKLTDFGIAYIPSSSMTQTGTVLGSPKYMSPEQVLGQPLDGRSDIFSLGVMLFEMLARRTPFERAGDSTIFALMHRIVSDPAPRLSELDPEIPAVFDLILSRALAKLPDERYRRASEFANDLRNYKSVAQAAGIQAEAELTQVVRRPPAEAPVSAPTPVAPNPEIEQKKAQLLADLDAFSRKYEDEQKRERAEAEATRAAKAAKAANAARTDEQTRAEAWGRGPASAPAAPAPAPASAGERSNSAVLRMLKQQAAAKSGQRAPAVSAAAMDALNARMRETFLFLEELVRQINEAAPEYARKQSLVYVGEMAGLVLSEGFVDFRSKKINDMDFYDYIKLSYRMANGRRLKVDLVREEVSRLRAELDRSGFKYEVSVFKDDFGQVRRASFDIDCQMPCNALLRADYAEMKVQLQCRNLGRPGPAKYALGADAINDATLDELGKLILGFPNRFETEFQTG